MKKFLIIYCISFLCYSCSQKETTPIKTVLIFYDLSSSTSNGSRADYNSETKKIIADLEPGDILIAEAITDKSIREKHEICNIQLPLEEAYSTNKFKKEKQKKDFEKLYASKLNEAENLISNALSDTDLQFESTDIFSAIQLSENIFKNFPGDKNILVFMSDMIESSKEYSFYKENLNEKRTNTIISEIKSKYSLPDLTGSEIYVCGADAASNANYASIQQFWITYFIAIGAHCTAEHYGASLLKFDE